jgi:hypothetical protein
VDSIAFGRTPYKSSVEVSFSDSLQTVTLSLQPRTLDGGTLFDVLTVERNKLSGIWTDGGAGYIGRSLRIDGVEVFEFLQGYFCAFRRSPI